VQTGRFGGPSFFTAWAKSMSVIGAGRVDLGAMGTHRFSLDRAEEAYEVFANRREGVLKLALTP
jgi:alcohol dehydrogenase